MTDLFIILLRNKAFKDDTDRLLSNLIHDYLRSLDCQKKFTNLIVEQVLRNKETVLPGLHKLLIDYLMGDSRAGLTVQGADVLINVLKINGVARSAIESITKETQEAMDNKAVYDAAIKAAMNSLKK